MTKEKDFSFAGKSDWDEGPQDKEFPLTLKQCKKHQPKAYSHQIKNGEVLHTIEYYEFWFDGKKVPAKCGLCGSELISFFKPKEII